MKDLLRIMAQDFREEDFSAMEFFLAGVCVLAGVMVIGFFGWLLQHSGGGVAML